MGVEIDLLAKYPKTERDLTKRLEQKTEEDRSVARKFDERFFDGERRHGYGGFTYNEKYWSPVVPDFIEHYSLKPGDRILDIGCAKGFMLHDFAKLMPGLSVTGIDISEYAISNSHPKVKEFLSVADAKNLPFPDNSFELVIAINTIHNLEFDECAQALREIQRVSSRDSFVVLDAYRTDLEKERMFAWNLTGKTILSVTDWKYFFEVNGYTGDYYWFMP
jgi:ubiquinone/menaquinone biosynthesis C-methylase UbiE